MADTLAALVALNGSSGGGNGSVGNFPAPTPYHPLLVAVVSILMVILSLVTIIGNAMVMLSFYLDKNIRQPANFYIFSLAASDFLIGALLSYTGREGKGRDCRSGGLPLLHHSHPSAGVAPGLVRLRPLALGGLLRLVTHPLPFPLPSLPFPSLPTPVPGFAASPPSTPSSASPSTATAPSKYQPPIATGGRPKRYSNPLSHIPDPHTSCLTGLSGDVDSGRRVDHPLTSLLHFRIRLRLLLRFVI